MDGEAWDETAWTWEASLLGFREFITNRTNNVFKKFTSEPKEVNEDVSTNF